MSGDTMANMRRPIVQLSLRLRKADGSDEFVRPHSELCIVATWDATACVCAWGLR